MDLLLKSISASAQEFLNSKSTKTKSANQCVIFWSGGKKQNLKKYLKQKLVDWQVEQLDETAIQEFSTPSQKVWVLWSDYLDTNAETLEHGSRLQRSLRGRARDICGTWLRTKKIKGHVDFHFAEAKDEEIFGGILGLGLASYNFINVSRGQESSTTWQFSRGKKKLPQDIIRQATALYTSMNLSRHLTNLPAETANPESLAQELAKFFKGRKGLSVKLWSEAELKKEKCGLLVGVGQGSRTGARLLSIKYGGAAKRKKPLAFVGKGVTFDTGGLDLKNSSGMRLMKKDMAGAAVMAGLCHFVSQLRLQQACDFYLPLAENAVSERSTRPGDVHEARNGLWVEIDNTDAEGRLVMADAFDMAIHPRKSATPPEALFDVATLTGAMRVAVGLDVAGYFSNNDKLAEKIEKSAQEAGEGIWRLPLYAKYEKSLSSSYADCKNSSDSGFAGAITAALFLKKFVDDVPWVHFDAMAWNSSGDGALSDGANAQCLQTLAQYLLKRG